MVFKQIDLENFRSYKDRVSISELSNVNVFIGPNSAGKSNVIESLKYLKGLLVGNQTRPFVEMVFDRNPNSEIRFSLSLALSAQRRDRIIDRLFEGHPSVTPANVKESSFLKTLTYSLTIKKNGITDEEVKVSNIKDGELTIIKRTKDNVESIGLDSKCKGLLRIENIKPSLAQRKQVSIQFRLLPYPKLSAPEQTLVKNIKDFVLGWEWFDPIRRASPTMESGEDLILQPTGNNLTRFMNSMQSNNPRTFIKLVDDVINIIPAISDILSPLKGRQATMNVHEKGLENPTDTGNISFGLMQNVILVVGIMTKKKGSVILIEEPELHLHATSQRRLFELIQREAKNKQFIITTHSTIFTACDDQNSTYLVTKPEGATGVIRIQDPKELKVVKDILGHRNTDLFGDECVVFVEGDSEEIAFPIIAKSLEYDLIVKGIRLVNVKGSGKATKIGEYLRYLKDSGVTSYVIADGNRRVKEKLEDWQREGIIEEDYWTVWNLEFEDCFSLDMIARGINEVLKEQGAEFQVTSDQLKNASKEGISIVKVLGKMLYENDLSLDKPALAEKLAFILSEDMQKEERIETLPEREIKRIVELVESRGKVPS